MADPIVQKETKIKEEILASNEVGYGVRPATLGYTLAGLAGLSIVLWMAGTSSKSKKNRPPMQVDPMSGEIPAEYVGYTPMGR